jgi:hypothetical protein
MGRYGRPSTNPTTISHYSVTGRSGARYVPLSWWLTLMSDAAEWYDRAREQDQECDDDEGVRDAAARP